MFIYAGWLFDHLNSSQIIQVGDRELDRYGLGHIPQAIYLDTSAFERPPSWNIIPDDQLEPALLEHGIHSEKQVVLYGNDRLAVSRLALALLYAGVRDLSILWGGVAAWSVAGYPLETGINPPIPVAGFGCKIPAHPEYISNMQQVRLLPAEQDAVLACVRSWDEFVGKVSGYDYIQPKGRIPGSVWAALPGSAAYRDQHSRDPASTAHLSREIEAGWRKQGLAPQKKTVFYCGTGWRASEAFLYARSLGWKNISIYDGGWLEWSSQADNPIEAGQPG